MTVVELNTKGCTCNLSAMSSYTRRGCTLCEKVNKECETGYIHINDLLVESMKITELEKKAKTVSTKFNCKTN